MIDAADDVPTVMDFGIARSAGGPGRGPTPKAIARPPGLADLSRTAALAASSTMAGAIVGTVAYMAPEQASGEAVDQRADIYAFGLILYDMLIGGRRSERAASAVAELQQRMQTPPPPPRSIDPSVPEAVDAIIRRCLEPDAGEALPDDRRAPGGARSSGRQRQAAADHPRGSRAARWRRRRCSCCCSSPARSTRRRQLIAPPTVHDPVAVLIADFQNNTNDPAFNGTLDQTLRRALEGASFITRIRPHKAARDLRRAAARKLRRGGGASSSRSNRVSAWSSPGRSHRAAAATTSQ